jgi:hypothetical protein
MPCDWSSIRTDLQALLRRKIRHAAMTGEIYPRIAEAVWVTDKRYSGLLGSRAT